MTKYSLKNICLGIGIGLILASMANISAAPRSLTEDEIRREAAKHNLMVVAAKDLINKQPEADKEITEQSKEDEQQTPVQPATEATEQLSVITVKSGSTSESIADLLMSNKLIDNKLAFMNRLKELNKESKLQIGTFKIPSGASIDRIIEIITSSPK